MVKKRGLGKSLDALLAYTDTQQLHRDIDQPEEQFTTLSLQHIERGKYQPRREMDREALEELAASIRVQGVIQPLIVRPMGDKYEIIAGERRFRAAALAGLEEVPVIIRSVPDEAAIAIALIENIQREDLNPIEEAFGLHRLCTELGFTHQQVAEAVGKSRTTVTNLLRLLALPHAIKTMLEKKQLEMGHARALLTLPETMQIDVAEKIVERQLSVRETENFIRQLQTPLLPSAKKPLDPDIIKLQDVLSKQLKMKVAIQCNVKGKGKLVIHYRNLTELDRLLAHLQEDVV